MTNCIKCLLRTYEGKSLDHQQLHESCTGQAGKMSQRVNHLPLRLKTSKTHMVEGKEQASASQPVTATPTQWRALLNKEMNVILKKKERKSGHT